MNEALLRKLKTMYDRYTELENLVADPAVVSNPYQYGAYMKERGNLSRLVGKYLQWQKTLHRKEEAGKVISENGGDKELQLLAKDELAAAEKKEERLVEEIQELLLSKAGDAHRGVIMEIRAGTGGDEAALFAADLYRMYTRYANIKGWGIEVFDSSSTDLGGFKEIIFSVTGAEVYKRLRHESGTHRVQRVPATETQGRVHTSAATVAVLPEIEEVEINIDPKDLRIETMRASGPGGQKVNKTSSAVRMTHIPTGITVKCQDEKSQHKNRAKAIRILRSRLHEHVEEQERSKREKARRVQIGTGDRSEKIRTYNYPQNRVTDHRINFTLYDLENVMLGHIDELIGQLLAFEKEEQLKQLAATV
ncbi:MAG TPA: peptide chain release factor 1 [Candidatus Avalokitesvara rifleensis]|uniref:peptide chain release factor 1 n=1 Tax=Candidatus Avalokitesvara rifleensis TaxID=3367620 RepID=UPI0027126E56|nr:peptide chain release factor 1 [Candidatus Brocadiales bacterium]